MDTNNIIDITGREAITDTLTDLLRTGAQHLITSAVEAELASLSLVGGNTIDPNDGG